MQGRYDLDTSQLAVFQLVLLVATACISQLDCLAALPSPILGPCMQTFNLSLLDAATSPGLAQLCMVKFKATCNGLQRASAQASWEQAHLKAQCLPIPPGKTCVTPSHKPITHVWYMCGLQGERQSFIAAAPTTRLLCLPYTSS